MNHTPAPTVCEGCNTGTGGTHLCPACLGVAARTILEAQELITVLAEHKPERGKALRPVGLRKGVEPVSLEAVEIRTRLARALRKITHRVYSTHHELALVTPRLAEVQGVWIFHTLLKAAVVDARRFLTPPPEVQLLGNCGDRCDGQVITYEGKGTAWCTDCGASYDAAWLRAFRAAHVVNEALPLREACELLTRTGVKITHAQARQWVRRGKLTAIGGHYRLRDLLAVHRATHPSGGA